jgi:glycosyltransferase involved in cell wall biosynthesis
MHEITYIYPRWKNVSFTRVAEEQIRGLSDRFAFSRIPENVLDNLLWTQARDILLHPILYITMGDNVGMFNARQRRLNAVLKVKRYIGGFETADSDRISEPSVEVLNKFDAVFLPSKFAVDSFVNSGVQTPCEVVPHGLSETMMQQEKTVKDKAFLDLLEMKLKTKAIFVLFFCLHSGYRKGIDIICNAMYFLQHSHKNLCLIVKSQDIPSEVGFLNHKVIRSWLSEDSLRQLYDLCDILVVPSRGGGFEMNALEGMARGIPTIVPDAGCFKDLEGFYIPSPVTGHPQVFPNNPIHIGNGWETDADALTGVIEKTIDDLDSLKEKFDARRVQVAKEHSWRSVCDNLYQLLLKYGFSD